ncbi:SGNH/GDSL hydrolase family protein [Pontibacter ramchanderi]|uniref:GDSL-like lipase/acylhydrolase family protein n=1 Tax=Pontibacter ramchanderi TaxID=1179743 RepID=A0A2N3UDB6_9BACT|nr:SGNH/GDSL hydrolase family protein [Pontibacter ramchanderi]PKV67366.1 GDSL-like lipase/acylhydrolase family protein [Pontibacter ramchanderi]
MKKFFYKSSVLALMAGMFLTSCDPEIDTPAASSGEADFSTYVALGNSLTAGFADGALYREGQQASYPAILAKQFEQVGGSSDFRQPLMPEGVSVGSPRSNPSNPSIVEVPQKRVLRIQPDCKGVAGLAPVEAGNAAALTPTFLGQLAPTVQGPYNNLGVPGAKSFHLLAPGYGNPAGLMTQPATANPFFARFASSPNTSVVADAMAQNPTFFTLWIGNNDVLGYALAGGTPSSTSSDYPTNKDMFTAYIAGIVNQLTSNGAKGALGNIPDVTKIPFFTTVPYNALVLTAEQAAQLTAGYAAKGLGHITFQAGPNALVVLEDGIPRKATPTELILLPAADLIKCQGLGSATPLPDQLVLSDAELAIIKDHTNSYNASIKAIADAKGLAHGDFNAYLSRLSTGFAQNGVSYNSAFVTGNIFSLDGIHFTPRGAALVANEFINVINTKYGARIPKVDETQYKTVALP